MATLEAGTFASWILTEEEEIQGIMYTVTQKQVLQNLLAVHAEEKMTLSFDPNDVLSFTQAEAYKRGQIDLLLYLIDSSDAMIDTQKEIYLAESNVSNNQIHSISSPMDAFGDVPSNPTPTSN